MLSKYIYRKILSKINKKILKIENKILHKIAKLNDEIDSNEALEWCYESNIKHINSLNSQKQNKIPKVLIVEINNFHGVTIPNYAIYFRKLGYHVDILQAFGDNVKLDFACRLRDSEITIYTGTVYEINAFLKKEEQVNYDFVIYNTTFNATKESIFKILNGVASGKFGIFLLEHNPKTCISDFNEQYFVNNEMLFTIGGQDNTRKVPCTEIGEVKIKYNLNRCINFCLVGAVTKDNKDLDRLFSGAKSLIQNGIRNFTITVIGPGNITVPNELVNFIKFKGYISYPKMYQLIEKCDFMLGMFSYDNPKHHKYLNDWYSGTRIMSLQFRKPIIIERKFAEFYSVTDDNGIVYDSFEMALFEAMSMTGEKYKKMILATEETSQALQKLGLKNLKEMIEHRKAIYGRNLL